MKANAVVKTVTVFLKMLIKIGNSTIYQSLMVKPIQHADKEIVAFLLVRGANSVANRRAALPV
jgi:hypothetical protein